MLFQKTVALIGEPSALWVENFLKLCQQEVNIAIPNSRDPKEVQEAWFDKIGVDEVIVIPYANNRSGASVALSAGSTGIDSGLFADPASRDPSAIRNDMPANILLKTSGSSARPKTVVHSCQNFIKSARNLKRQINLNSNHIWNLSLPIYHVGGLNIIFRCLLSGAKLSYGKADLNQITHISLVNTQLKKLLEDQNNIGKLKKLDLILLGGGFIEPELKEKLNENKINVAVSYGSTETCSAVLLDEGDGLKVLGGNKIKIDSGSRCAVRSDVGGNVGEILIESSNLFLGYLGCESGMTAISDDGYYKTGDLGYLDQNQNLIITGRKSNLIISGGENVQGEEVEEVLKSFDFVQEAIVFGVLDKKYGERPHAVIKYKVNSQDPGLRQGDIKLAQGDHRLKNKLAKYKIPDKFYAWPKEFEVNGNVKISREKIKDLVLNQK